MSTYGSIGSGSPISQKSNMGFEDVVKKDNTRLDINFPDVKDSYQKLISKCSKSIPIIDEKLTPPEQIEHWQKKLTELETHRLTDARTFGCHFAVPASIVGVPLFWGLSMVVGPFIAGGHFAYEACKASTCAEPWFLLAPPLAIVGGITGVFVGAIVGGPLSCNLTAKVGRSIYLAATANSYQQKKSEIEEELKKLGVDVSKQQKPKDKIRYRGDNPEQEFIIRIDAWSQS